MSRVRMSWDWVGDYPIFVYTRFIDNKKFNVPKRRQHRTAK
jgi:hypothetical protein